MRITKSVSLRAYFIIVLGLIITYFAYQRNYPTRETIGSDGYNYYIFLPATFIYHDLTMKYVETLPDELKKYIWVSIYPGKDYRISKMTSGVAVLMLPFFLIGHLIAILGNFPANGYSHPYHSLISFAAIFYFLIGLYFIRKSLLYFFSETITSIALFIPFCLTNLINYTIWEPSMSHVYSFFLVSVMVYHTITWHKNFKTKNLLWLAISLGMIALVRPSNLLSGIFPVLYGINNRELWKRKINELFPFPIKLTVAVVIFLIPLLLQMSLWKYQTGSWIIDSYTGEHFYFNHPHIMDVLFGFRSGWLIYTPVMIFAVAGFYFLIKYKYSFNWSVILFFIPTLYLTSSWWCYWYGGTFGMRPFIDFYPIFLLPLTATLKELFNKKIVRICSIVVLVFFCWLNLLQQYQFQRALLHYAYMTPRAYIAVFGKTHYPPDFESLLDPDDVEMALQGKPMRHVFRLDAFNNRVIEEKDISIKASNGKYVSADQTLNFDLVANRDGPYSWETFKLVTLEGNQYLLRAWNESYVCNDSGNVQRVNRYAPKECTLYYIDTLGNNNYTLKTSSGKYVTFDDSENHVLRAFADAKSEKTIFTILKK